MAQAATWRLIQELREAQEDMRDVDFDIIRSALEQGADANAQEEESVEFDEDDVNYNLTALQLLVTNTYVAMETMHQAMTALVEAKADVNMDVNESPLLSAVRHRCIVGVRALSSHGVKVTPEVLEEIKGISGTKSRHQVEDILQPIINRDKSLRCPLWIWVQAGGVTAVEALLRNSSHDEEVEVDVLVGLQRCRGTDADKQLIADQLKEFVGEEEFKRLSAVAGTRRLLHELREAHTEDRDIDIEVVHSALAQGANPNAREESLDDAEDEEEEEIDEEEVDGDEEEDDDDDGEDDDDQDEAENEDEDLEDDEEDDGDEDTEVDRDEED